MADGKVKNLIHKKGVILLLASIAVCIVLVSILSYLLILPNRIYPNTNIAGISVGLLKPQEAQQLIAQSINTPENIVLISKDQEFTIPVNEIGFSYNFPESVQIAYGTHRSGNLLTQITAKAKSLTKTTTLGLVYNIDKDKLNEYVSVINGQVSVESIEPKIILEESTVSVVNGIPGRDVDTESLHLLINNNLAYGAGQSKIVIPTKINDPSLSEEEVQKLTERAEKYIGKNITLEFDGDLFTLKTQDILDLLDPKSGYVTEGLGTLIEGLAESINRPANNPVFNYQNGRVVEFEPARPGIAINKLELTENIVNSLNNLRLSDTVATINIPYAATKPDITTEQVNSMGIKELMGRGTSRFVGSISSRIHNIGVASNKFNGVLIAPGDTVSFNEILGDVSEFTGYKKAYIIKDGKTILGDGGGVCQVSTTFFRAALDSGLPIVERSPHSYRVTYYEQDSGPGLDATVYSPTTDLKIQNDTPAHILVQTLYNPNAATLAFEFYGTSDGRVSTTSRPVVTSQTEPPEDLYTDDPNLPTGVVEQIDWKAWGAKTNFQYKVIRAGEILQEKTFYSNYRPWQAKFLRGTGPVI